MQQYSNNLCRLCVGLTVLADASRQRTECHGHGVRGLHPAPASAAAR